MNAKKIVVKFAKLATLHVCQACLPCFQRLHAVLLAAMAKAPATFFIAVSKVSFDAVTSMPSASAIEIKHCQQHQGVVTFLSFWSRNSRSATTPMTSVTGRGVQHSFAYFCEGFFCNTLAGFFIVEAFFALATGFAFALAFALALLFACDFA